MGMDCDATLWWGVDLGNPDDARWETYPAWLSSEDEERDDHQDWEEAYMVINCPDLIPTVEWSDETRGIHQAYWDAKRGVCNPLPCEVLTYGTHENGLGWAAAIRMSIVTTDLWTAKPFEQELSATRWVGELKDFLTNLGFENFESWTMGWHLSAYYSY